MSEEKKAPVGVDLPCGRVELVKVYDLKVGDSVLLDTGLIAIVKGVARGSESDRAVLRLKGRGPITVIGHNLPFVRKVLRE